MYEDKAGMSERSGRKGAGGGGAEGGTATEQSGQAKEPEPELLSLSRRASRRAGSSSQASGD